MTTRPLPRKAMARHNLDAGDHRASDGQSRYRERIALVVQQGGYIEQLNAPDLLQQARAGARADFVGPNRNVASVLGMASIGRCSRASVSRSAVRSPQRRHSATNPAGMAPRRVVHNSFASHSGIRLTLSIKSLYCVFRTS